MEDSPEQRRVILSAFAFFSCMMPIVIGGFLQALASTVISTLMIEKIRHVALADFPLVLYAAILFMTRVIQRDKKNDARYRFTTYGGFEPRDEPTGMRLGPPSLAAPRIELPPAEPAQVFSIGPPILGPAGTPCSYCAGSGREKFVNEEHGESDRFTQIGEAIGSTDSMAQT